MNFKKYITIVIVALLACAAVYGGIITANIMVKPFTEGEHGDAIAPAVDEKITFLLVGKDHVGNNTDTIMVITAHTQDNKISILSVPRDTKATVNGSNMKINAVYSHAAYKGLNDEETLINTVTEITGIPINYYAIVDLKAFRDIVDELDGVWYDVPRNYYYNDPYQDLTINLKKGEQLLNGKQAEGLVRYRHDYVRADLERVEVQQDFIKEIIKQKLNVKYITKIPAVYKLVSEHVISNLKVEDIISFAKALTGVEDEGMNSHTMPCRESGGYVIVNKDEMAQLAEEEF